MTWGGRARLLFAILKEIKVELMSRRNRSHSELEFFFEKEMGFGEQKKCYFFFNVLTPHRNWRTNIFFLKQYSNKFNSVMIILLLTIIMYVLNNNTINFLIIIILIYVKCFAVIILYYFRLNNLGFNNTRH